MKKKPQTKKKGVVKKVIKPLIPSDPEKAEISLEDADHLYREIRIENKLQDEHGNDVKLKENADVEVIVEAEEDATVPEHGRKNHASTHHTNKPNDDS